MPNNPPRTDLLAATRSPHAPLFYFVNGMAHPDEGGLLDGSAFEILDEPDDTIVRLYDTHMDSCEAVWGGGMLTPSPPHPTTSHQDSPCPPPASAAAFAAAQPYTHLPRHFTKWDVTVENGTSPQYTSSPARQAPRRSTFRAGAHSSRGRWDDGGKVPAAYPRAARRLQ
ncbi:hypothetical protein GGTG_13077 [Gaeumannomyces tritici R3-111a-1]|uniref:Uncharacterized protein n=1 Tax=Gaeumannomyces tritici (strain R3-111a-1) TaxID=644352 RepID=J3PHU6_GAET3|nr:hypothetical protein GGTG_13077 [Gaeumannomyces tritici R3-111a-1]EJT69458.1 hypothetical protein GGTG_13077 [Gaeumannomyces tritici R3-111a-1]